MIRSPQSYNRQAPRFKEQPKLLIICEDSKSGLNYIKDACTHYRITVQVEVAHVGRTDPRGIVQQGLKRQRKYDHVYCMIDRDTHASFDEALRLAQDSLKLTVIFSNPCFEFWLLLHFGFTRRPYVAAGEQSAADILIRKLKEQECMREYDKGSGTKIFPMLLDKLNAACASSQRALQEAENDGNYNPSTKLHMLISKFEEMDKPKPITT